MRGIRPEAVISIPPTWKSLPLKVWSAVPVLCHQSLAEKLRSQERGTGGGHWHKGWGSGRGVVPGPKDQEQEGNPWYQEAEARKGGGTAVTRTYQYTTRTASAMARDCIPAQSKDANHQQRQDCAWGRAHNWRPEEGGANQVR